VIMEETIHEECRGCLANIPECVFQFNYKYNHLECPCIECLVKGMCTKACSEYDEYSLYPPEMEYDENNSIDTQPL